MTPLYHPSPTPWDLAQVPPTSRLPLRQPPPDLTSDPWSDRRNIPKHIHPLILSIRHSKTASTLPRPNTTETMAHVVQRSYLLLIIPSSTNASHYLYQCPFVFIHQSALDHLSLAGLLVCVLFIQSNFFVFPPCDQSLVFTKSKRTVSLPTGSEISKIYTLDSDLTPLYTIIVDE